MHLLNARTQKLETFVGEAVPRYAILSHTWAEEEVLFEDLPFDENVPTKKGYEKVQFTCRQALEDGLEYVWIDTLCIDKKSSSELSESINSMYKWYRESSVCYAHLADVAIDPDTGEWSSQDFDTPIEVGQGLGVLINATGALEDLDLEDSAASENKKQVFLSRVPGFATSRWFSRGWTLQELIAPRSLCFFDAGGARIGQRSGTIGQVVSDITGIPWSVFIDSQKLQKFTIAMRMSWAAQRQTTRKEDEAYCLLGIFDVNMPLLYGEGGRAFVRLQEAIIASSADQTIFAWDFPDSRLLSSKNGSYQQEDARRYLDNRGCNLLAPSPAAFANSAEVLNGPRSHSRFYEFTNQGLKINLPIKAGPSRSRVFAILNCRFRGGWLALGLYKDEPESLTYGVYATSQGRLHHMGAATAAAAVKREIIIRKSPVAEEAGISLFLRRT